LLQNNPRTWPGRDNPHDSVVMIEEIAGESVIVSPQSEPGQGRGLFT
jgi:hypothetical protein